VGCCGPCFGGCWWRFGWHWHSESMYRETVLLGFEHAMARKADAVMAVICAIEVHRVRLVGKTF